MPFIRLKKFLLFLCFWVFIVDGYWVWLNVFFCIYWSFVLYCIYVMYYINWFWGVKTTLYFCNKFNMVILYNSFILDLLIYITYNKIAFISIHKSLYIIPLSKRCSLRKYIKFILWFCFTSGKQLHIFGCINILVCMHGHNNYWLRKIKNYSWMGELCWTDKNLGSVNKGLRDGIAVT